MGAVTHRRLIRLRITFRWKLLPVLAPEAQSPKVGGSDVGPAWADVFSNGDPGGNPLFKSRSNRRG